MSTPEVASGLKYLPVPVKLPTLGRGGIVRVIRKLDELGIRCIRFQLVDYTNVVRNYIIPLPALELLEASRPRVGIARAAFGIVGSSMAPGFSATGKCLYIPDLSTIRLCGYASASGHASLMGLSCWKVESAPISPTYQEQYGGINTINSRVPQSGRNSGRSLTYTQRHV
ncbi:hypothetical protein H4582DRAFT_1072445 [Lactarius indigo]|nr:hypothetical protein H4582DRAFT_1072445 [Lactarius indigo]